MRDLLKFRTEISPTFDVNFLDLFDPSEIKNDVVKKGPKKIYDVLFTFYDTHAVHKNVSVDYFPEFVLHTICRLKAVRGEVRNMTSDPETQLVGASKELIKVRRGWNKHPRNFNGGSL